MKKPIFKYFCNFKKEDLVLKNTKRILKNFTFVKKNIYKNS